ncbi:hypothetical protein K435DRAFT_196349 [Dendrothele bispora CBS 962.96]|uniref:Uncharacterized protein n=1 Tax=Dendrothele bispora (strain CBS 962.96) TaxID=1314807 RepID=A0A4S8MNW8_DENBC|nr:hypothetical protein K435DRAFT_196349 [Dendrothele bispora CBS 962.96]
MVITCGVVVCAALSLRVYAIYTRHRIVLGIMIAAASISIAVILWSVFTEPQRSQLREASQQTGCNFVTLMPAPVSAITWELVLGYELLLFFLLLFKSWSMRRIRTPLLSILFRDGVMYHGITCLAYIANIATYYVGLIIL